MKRKDEPVSLRARIEAHIKERYGAEPEHLWLRWPEYAVFRHADSKKWFGIIMDIPRSKLGLKGEGRVDAINLKSPDPLLIDLLVNKPGYFRGYHQSKGHWVTVLLDGTVEEKELISLIEMSYMATASAQKRQRLRGPKEWVVPSNPGHYDIVRAYDDTDTIIWKQGRGIKKGDVVFIYAGAPVSAILYKTEVVETDIPFDFKTKGLTITAVMRLKLLKRFDPERFTFRILNEVYGVYAVRGPRGIPEPLSRDLNGRV
ncbi:MAG: MmcQ/YjbR family DNA-binding protein [Clostridia bacterium]|nr:MmcQ/YjbR family DNA-binding protein [Clostridia bacterium]